MQVQTSNNGFVIVDGDMTWDFCRTSRPNYKITATDGVYIWEGSIAEQQCCVTGQKCCIMLTKDVYQIIEPDNVFKLILSACRSTCNDNLKVTFDSANKGERIAVIVEMKQLEGNDYGSFTIFLECSNYKTIKKLHEENIKLKEQMAAVVLEPINRTMGMFVGMNLETRELNLSGGMLSQYIDYLHKLPNLRILNISDNNLKTLPPQIMELKLERLYICNNPFESIDEGLMVDELYISFDTYKLLCGSIHSNYIINSYTPLSTIIFPGVKKLQIVC